MYFVLYYIDLKHQLISHIFSLRSVFGGTVGPNPMKPANSSDPQYYDGIKPRAQPLVISIQSASSTTAVTPPQQPQQQVSLKNVRRNKPQTIIATPTTASGALTVIADSPEVPPASPASPILKAQLSAPPKQREVAPGGTKTDPKSQVGGFPRSGCVRSLHVLSEERNRGALP